MNDDFSKNEIRFGRNYVGRPFHGTLPLYSISEEMFTKGAYNVSFGDHTSGVDCVVSDKNNLDYITRLNSGDNVTISGRVDSHAIGFDVSFRNVTLRDRRRRHGRLHASLMTFCVDHG
jgi:hypothetical protein